MTQIPDAPSGIYCRGDSALLARPTVAMVGSRVASWHGRAFASQLAGQMAALGFVIVSGLARGIDAVCHQGALSVGGKTIAVLGHGCDLVYPKQNSLLFERIVTEGLLISEYPDGTPARPHHFPARNRLVTGLCDALIVLEAKAGSGSLISARLALEQGREVFAVPGPVLQGAAVGCHQLIREGAHLLDSIGDLYREAPGLFEGCSFDASINPASPISISDASHQILSLLSGGPLVLANLREGFEGRFDHLLDTLHALELKGLIARAGLFYHLKA